jgi:hypothetical protein
VCLASPLAALLLTFLQAGVDVATVKTGRECVAARKLTTSVEASWGDISLVEAQLDSMGELLRRCPHVTHIGLASGHDIPTQMLRWVVRMLCVCMGSSVLKV